MRFEKTVLFLVLSFLFAGAGSYAQDSGTPFGSAAIAGQWSEGWYQNASGYDQAVEEHKRTHKPMLVYLTVAWCPYCRRFERSVLSSPLVQDRLKDKIKVVINPEAGSREDAIAFQYGIQGFPSVFLHPPGPGEVVRLSTGVTPETFVEYFDQVLK